MISKITIRVIAAILPALLTVVMINYRVDPALVLRDGDYERQVAQGIIDNKIVGITTNYNERKVLRYVIQNMEVSPDGIIVGASRVMSIPCEKVGFTHGFNNGLSGATIADIISVIGMYDDRNMLPNTVIIGIEPFWFNENHGDTRYMELIPEYNEFSDKLGLPRLQSETPAASLITKIEQALSPSYFQASLQDIERTFPVPVITDEVQLDCNNRLPDGTIVYSEEMRLREEDVVSEIVLMSLRSMGIHQSSNYRELSPPIIKQFTALIDFMMSKDIDVTFVLTPFHPVLYKNVVQNSNYRMLIEAENYVRDFATDYNINIIGSYDPDKVGATNSDFYDGYHPKREFMEAYYCRTIENANTVTALIPPQ